MRRSPCKPSGKVIACETQSTLPAFPASAEPPEESAMNSSLSVFCILAMFFAPSNCVAQTQSAPAPAQAKSAAPPSRKVSQTPDVEQDFRQQQLAKMKREHSDDKGQLRPDLFAKGVAQMQRMKVVIEPGAAPKTQPAEKP